MRLWQLWVLASMVGCGGEAGAPAVEPQVQVLLDQTPPVLDNHGSAVFAFTADREGASFLCRVDAAAFAPCVSPHTVTVTDGDHIFEATAVRNGMPSSQVARFAWTVDTVAPDTTLLARPPVQSNSSEAVFEFRASEAAAFRCALDGAPAVACTSGYAIARLAAGMHRFTVQAVDAAGNADPTPATAGWSVDQVTPETTVTTATADPTTARTAVFSFTADVPGCAFACALDDAAPAPCNAPLALTDLSDGRHTLRVRATSPANNVDPTPATFAWTVDTTGPTTTITSGPANGAATGASVHFAFTSEAGATFACGVDDALLDACSGAGVHDLTGLGDGPHHFRVSAQDALGNPGPVETRDFTVDTVHPQVTIAVDARVNRNASIWFEVSEHAVPTCRIDATPIVPCRAPVALTGVAEGAHTFTLTATDAAGNATTASRDFTLDATPPVLAIPFPADGQLVGKTFTVHVDSNEPIAFYLCRLDGASFFHNCDATTTYQLSGGAHVLEVLAYDEAMNESATLHRAFTVDDVPPRITITSPADGERTPLHGAVTFSVTKNASTVCKLTGETAFHPCTSPLAFDLENGIARVDIEATDAVGNSATATRTWQVFAPVPDISITYPAEQELTTGSVAFQFHSSIPVTQFLCRLDAAPGYTPCEQGFTATLATGAHTLRIHGIGLDGRAGSDTVRTWRVDADHQFVDIFITNDCHVSVSPSSFVVQRADELSLLFFNRSHDYPVAEVYLSYGGALTDLYPGTFAIDPIPHCTVKGHDEYADILTPCASPVRVPIHCL